MGSAGILSGRRKTKETPAAVYRIGAAEPVDVVELKKNPATPESEVAGC